MTKRQLPRAVDEEINNLKRRVFDLERRVKGNTGRPVPFDCATCDGIWVPIDRDDYDGSEWILGAGVAGGYRVIWRSDGRLALGDGSGSGDFFINRVNGGAFDGWLLLGPSAAAGVLLGDAGECNLRMVQGYIEAQEISTPAAPDANYGRMFVRDNGSGKTQLCVIFNTGAVQVLATQP